MILESNFNFTTFDSLESHQKRLRLLSKTAEVGDWYYMLKTNVMTWSEYLYDFYELDKTFDCSTLLKKTSLYSALQKERILAFIDHVISTKAECTEEFMIVMNDGRLKWQATTIYPILEDDGEIIGLYGILQNISLRKQVEEGKKKAQFFYNYILDRLPTELVVLNKDGQYIFANHAAIKSKERRGVVIRTEQDAHGDNGNWASAVGSRRNEVMKECLASNKAVIFEEIFPGSDGIERAYIRNLHPFLDANDEVEFLVGYGIDITELKETKETSFKQYQAIECAMDGIALLDKTGRYYYLNASYATILGYKAPREITGKTLNAFYPDHEIERINNDILPILEKKGSWGGEILGKKKMV